jgi:predicted membrane channel-forming protein YqfA (hemolysin III family)
MRLRKLIGALGLFALVTAWALIAMAVAQFPAIRDSRSLSLAYYVIAGLGWVLPAMPLVRWMSAARSGVQDRRSRI